MTTQVRCPICNKRLFDDHVGIAIVTIRCPRCRNDIGYLNGKIYTGTYVEPLSEEECEKVFVRYDGKCVYCGGEATTIDHITPRSKGGTNNLANLVPACKDCNEEKGDERQLGLGDWGKESMV